ncbi:60S acidic ribosomal protein P2 [Phytophthora cinnamomi]|uniref:60S acidic ribosomal protein P2 n=1 Tax=Phytophthora cinnamomi TaxID=4785 RepID=UPI0035595389|nr:60S acidic ribosomal protein P2 [Phytophthora cinnamomi]
MASSKNEEVAALEAARLVRGAGALPDSMNEKLQQMNQQNECVAALTDGRTDASETKCLFFFSCAALRVLENWSSVIAISVSAASAAATAAGKPHAEKELVRTSP